MGVLTIKEIYSMAVCFITVFTVTGCANILKNSFETVKISNRSPDGNFRAENKLKNSYYTQDRF